MAIICICDGCGKQGKAWSNGRDWFKPYSWFERTPEGEKTPIQACSRECIERVETARKERGESSTTVVLPI